MDPLDQFVQRTLGCRAYLRYVDDFALFHDDKAAHVRHADTEGLRLHVLERFALEGRTLARKR